MARLGDICKMNMGQSPDSSTYNDHGIGLPFYQGNADFGEVYPSARVYCSSPVKVAQKGDILISVRAPIGALNMANEKCCIGRGLAAITANEDVCDKQYLWYVLLSKVEELNAKGTGSTFKAINRNILDETEIPLIPIDDQKQISDQLDKVVSLISLRKKQLQKLDDLIKSRFVEMFGDNATKTTLWRRVMLGDVCDVRDGTHDSPKYYDEGYPLVTSKNVAQGKIDFSDCNLICEDDYRKINVRSKVDKGDILMPMIGTVGKPIIVDVDKAFAIKNVALIKFYHDTKVTNTFVRILLQSDYFDKEVISKIRGGTQQFIALKDIRKLEFNLPPLIIQTEYQCFVAQIEKSKLKVQQGLYRLGQMKQALMQKYFG